MYGVDIDNDADAPVATPEFRRTVAIHWEWTTDYSREQMASALGVTKQTIRAYLNDGPNEEVKEVISDLESEVRTIAVMELKAQLKAAGHRSRSAETPVKVWEDDAGNLRVRDVRDDVGELVEKVPIPDDVELGADEEARYYARAEVREILEQLTDLVGAGEPDEHEVQLTDVLLDDS
jgi:transcriptional regulator with XRE-family HTH domain